MNVNNGNSIHANATANPTDTGILAVALRALADFSPALVPVGKNSQAVIATCPVCIGERGSIGSLRVEAVDVPQRLSWHCYLHNGGFAGVQYALGKHKSAQVSDLVHRENSASTKSDTAPGVDPAADHQKEHTCANWENYPAPHKGLRPFNGDAGAVSSLCRLPVLAQSKAD